MERYIDSGLWALHAAKRWISFPDAEFQDLFRLTPNAPLSGAGARSAEASTPAAGWAADGLLILLCVVLGYSCLRRRVFFRPCPFVRPSGSGDKPIGSFSGLWAFVGQSCTAPSPGNPPCPARHQRFSLDGPLRLSPGGAMLSFPALAPPKECFFSTQCSDQTWPLTATARP